MSRTVKFPAELPGGAAGGDLIGTYPNPTVGANKITQAKSAIGTGVTQLAGGDDARFPTTGQKNALAGAHGTPGTGTEYLTKASLGAAGAAGKALAADDTTTTNARTPSAHTHPESEVTNLVADLAAKQPLDSDLTAIAALVTTAYGRSVLDRADAAALRTLAGTVIGTDVEAHDSDLTTIAAIAPANDDVIQRKAGAWTNRTIAQVRADLEATSYAARVRHSAAQANANNTVTVLTFDTEDFDTAALHDTVTNPTRLTAPVAGRYSIYGNVNWASNVTGYRDVYIRLNGATVIDYKRVHSVQNSGTLIGVNTEYQLAANDYVELVVIQNSGGSLNINSVASYTPVFGMSRLGA